MLRPLNKCASNVCQLSSKVGPQSFVAVGPSKPATKKPMKSSTMTPSPLERHADGADV